MCRAQHGAALDITLADLMENRHRVEHRGVLILDTGSSDRREQVRPLDTLLSANSRLVRAVREAERP
jgi:hypothetical protein